MKTIEACLTENLSGSALQTALAFAAFLRENGISCIRDEGFWRDKIYFMLKLREGYVGYIAIKDPDEPENLWTVWSDGEDSHWYAEAMPIDEILSSAIRHIDYCVHCGSCSGGKQRRIFGRDFENVCGTTFRIDNPRTEDLPFLEYMIQMRKDEISTQEV